MVVCLTSTSCQCNSNSQGLGHKQPVAAVEGRRRNLIVEATLIALLQVQDALSTRSSCNRLLTQWRTNRPKKQII